MNLLPAGLAGGVRAALQTAGDDTAIRSAQPVGGGCINNATRLQTERRAYLLKWNPSAPPKMFQQEVYGLRLLAATRTVRVPEVYADGADTGSAFLLMEWLEPSGNADPARLGEQLAALHHWQPAGLDAGSSDSTASTSELAYGLDQDNNIGGTPQLNTWHTDWAEFFVNCRLLPQIQIAGQLGRLTAQRRGSLERLVVRIPALLGGTPRRPSLIHGDLWGGNVIHGPDGLALIDPAVSFSDREAELAFTTLFGGFSPRFYAAYQQAWPLDPGYTQRVDLYNLYHLLNHLNLFGESYGPSVDAAARRYL